MDNTPDLNAYHDWLIYGFEVDDDIHSTTVRMKNGSQKKILHFKDVEILQIDNFTIANIVLSMELSEGEDAMSRISNRLESGALASDYISIPTTDDLEQKAMNEGYKFVSISASYGCVGSIFCRTISESKE